MNERKSAGKNRQSKAKLQSALAAAWSRVAHDMGKAAFIEALDIDLSTYERAIADAGDRERGRQAEGGGMTGPDLTPDHARRAHNAIVFGVCAAGALWIIIGGVCLLVGGGW